MEVRFKLTGGQTTPAGILRRSHQMQATDQHQSTTTTAASTAHLDTLLR